MNYENNLARYNAVICDNQLFVMCRERYSINLGKLQATRDPVKIIQYKSILNQLGRILKMFLDIEFPSTT